MRGHTRRISRRAFLGGAVALGTVSLANPSLAFAVTSAEKQAEADTVRNQVYAMQDELTKASDSYYAALDEHDAAVAAMDEAQGRIDDANEKITGLQDQLSTRARSMYRNGNLSFLDVLFESASFEEFTTNWDILNQMNENDSKLVEETKTLREQIEAEKAEYSRQEQIAADKAAEAKTIKEQAEVTIAELETTLNSLDAEARALLEQEQAAAAAAAAEAERIAFEQAQAAAAAEAGNSGGGGDGGGGDGGGDSGETWTGGGGSDLPTNGSVLDYAISRIGCPYVWGAEGPDSFDCSGLVTWCYRQVGMYVPHQSESQKAAARAVLPLSDAQPGDVLHRVGHVGICAQAGGNLYVHAPTFGAYVRYDDNSWSGFVCALRF